MTQKQKWYILAAVSVLLTAPNAMIMRSAVEFIDPNLLNVLRYLLVFLLAIPFMAPVLHLFRGKALFHATVAALSIAVASVTFLFAIKYSQASYVSLLLHLTPVILVIYAVHFDSERVNRRTMAGIALAAMGAMLITFMPLAISHGQPFHFYPLATILALLNCLIYPLCTISLKKANAEHGVPILALVGYMALFSTMVSLVLWIVSGSPVPTGPVKMPVIVGVLYSAIFTSFIARSLGTLVYEKVGASVVSMFIYAESFVSVLLPVIFLHEKLSVGMVLGGMLMLFGVFLAERHNSQFHRRHRTFKSH